MSTIEDILDRIDMSDDEKCGLAMSYLEREGTEREYELLFNRLLDSITLGFFYHRDKLAPSQKLYLNYIKKALSTSTFNNNLYYQVVVCFFDKQYDLFNQHLASYLTKIGQSTAKITHDELVYSFARIFKNAYKGFWDGLAAQIEKYDCGEDGVPELCKALEIFYHSNSLEEAVDFLLNTLTKYPHYYMLEELLAFAYHKMKLWKNSIAYYERLRRLEAAYFFEYNDIIAFNLALAYGKTKNHVKESALYEEVLRIYPDGESAKNNLAYSYYRQGLYDKAHELFAECIAENRDAPYCYNNMVRTLIAMGKPAEALAFAKQNLGRAKVSNATLKIAEKAASGKVLQQSDVLGDEKLEDENTGAVEQERDLTVGSAAQQFSSERVLEDELILRIERGIPVFGTKLHVYEQEGDFYGRQYPFAGGRIDILAADESNNLYAIELKKDSGYDDAYRQTRSYVDWLRDNKAAPGAKVYGIVCLNNPSADIVKKVRDDTDIRLFEYSISINEIT